MDKITERADLNFYDAYYAASKKDYESVMGKYKNNLFLLLKIDVCKLILGIDLPQTKDGLLDEILRFYYSSSDNNQIQEELVKTINVLTKEFLIKYKREDPEYEINEDIKRFSINLLNLNDKIYRDIKISGPYKLEMANLIYNLIIFILDIKNYRLKYDNSPLYKLKSNEIDKLVGLKSKYLDIISKQDNVEFNNKNNYFIKILYILKDISIFFAIIMLIVNTTKYQYLLYWSLVFILTSPSIYRRILPVDFIKIWDKKFYSIISLRVIFTIILIVVGINLSFSPNEISLDFMSLKNFMYNI